MQLAVIIVSWNTRALTLQAIRTVAADLAASPIDHQIWVVDNDSRDESAEVIEAALPSVHLIRAGKNLGFAGGNNLALRTLGFSETPQAAPNAPHAIYLLNSDTITHSGATPQLYQTLMSDPQIGVVGARLTYEDGSFQHSAFGFPGLAQLVIDLYPVDRLPRRIFGKLYHSRLNGRYPQSAYQGTHPFPVGHTLGATMMIRRQAIEATGLFDTQFYMYAEEVDWSMRIQRAGYRIYTDPRAHVTHLEGQSTKQVRAASVLNLWKSRYRFYKKYASPLKFRVIQALIRNGAGWQLRKVATLPEPTRTQLQAVWQQIQQLHDLDR
jgi:GT2 family glycosyltransferase